MPAAPGWTRQLSMAQQTPPRVSRDASGVRGPTAQKSEIICKRLRPRRREVLTDSATKKQNEDDRGSDPERAVEVGIAL